MVTPSSQLTYYDTCVIGGGAVGLACAYFLQKHGGQTILVEKDKIMNACSFGNAGLIATSYVTPLAAPGMLSKGFRSLLDPDGSFGISAPFRPALMAWLLKFARNCRQKEAQIGANKLATMLTQSAALYQKLAAEINISDQLQQKGSLSVYTNRRYFEESFQHEGQWDAVNVRYRRLDSESTLALEPNLSGNIIGGRFFPDDAHIEPLSFYHAVAERFLQLGGRIVENALVQEIRRSGGTEIESIQLPSGRVRARNYVLAAGVWSPGIVKKLGIKVPVEAGRGFSITSRRSESSVRLPLFLEEAKMHVTPMADRIRATGMLELSGLRLDISPKKIERLRDRSQEYLKRPLDRKTESVWAGLRPCSSDGLPIIKRAPRCGNLILATGHSMLGISLAPVSGKIVSDLILEKPNMLN